MQRMTPCEIIEALLYNVQEIETDADYLNNGYLYTIAKEMRKRLEELRRILNEPS